jgi:hypothetical protein
MDQHDRLQDLIGPVFAWRVGDIRPMLRPLFSILSRTRDTTS